MRSLTSERARLGTALLAATLAASSPTVRHDGPPLPEAKSTDLWQKPNTSSTSTSATVPSSSSRRNNDDSERDDDDDDDYYDYY